MVRASRQPLLACALMSNADSIIRKTLLEACRSFGTFADASTFVTKTREAAGSFYAMEVVSVPRCALTTRLWPLPPHYTIWYPRFSRTLQQLERYHATIYASILTGLYVTTAFQKLVRRKASWTTLPACDPHCIVTQDSQTISRGYRRVLPARG
jgi:hypothetical protein